MYLCNYPFLFDHLLFILQFLVIIIIRKEKHVFIINVFLHNIYINTIFNILLLIGLGF
jgi:hypothetical protein